jgi:hypothetical protein
MGLEQAMYITDYLPSGEAIPIWRMLRPLAHKRTHADGHHRRWQGIHVGDQHDNGIDLATDGDDVAGCGVAG